MSTFFLLGGHGVSVSGIPISTAEKMCGTSRKNLATIPLFKISKALHQSIKINRVRAIKVKLVRMSLFMLFRSQAFVERILQPVRSHEFGRRWLYRGPFLVGGFGSWYHYKDDNPRYVQGLHDFHSDGRFTGAGTTSNPDNTQVRPWWRVTLPRLGGSRVHRRDRLHDAYYS